MAVGGYSSALLIVNQNFPIWAALIGSIIVAFVSGLILGVIAARLSGPYLAGTTLVIALAIPTIANRFESVLAGNIGFIVDFKSPPAWVTSIFGEIGYEHWQLIATLPFAALTFFFISNILKSRSGRSWKALRDNETAASLLGIKISNTKVLVFAVSSAFAGLAGALYGLRGIVGPSVYAVSLSLSLLTAAILGGVRSIFGALLGTVIIVFLPDWIHDVVKALELSEQVSNFLPAFFAGALLVLTVVINPGGIASNLHHHKK
jgi:branched-chain amino acid transport system permease protein